MKQITLPLFSSLAVLIAFGGCATTTGVSENKVTMLTAAGFKTVTPKTAAQQQKLKALPPGSMAMITKGNKTFYVFPDAANNQAYVGGPQEFQAYQQLRAQKQLAQEQLAAAEMYQDSAMGWGAWGGWGVGWGGMGMGYRRF